MVYINSVIHACSLKAIRRLLSATALSAAGVTVITTPALAQNWTDHQAIVGNITIDTAVPSTTNITQHTHFTKVQGNGDIDSGWTVNVAQPSNSSKYVLYDTKNDPTRIMGSLNANGEIYIFDQNGVIFGQSSRVDVGSLVATTGHIADADILNDDGRLTIVGATEGAIELKGAISVKEAGLAGFVAPTVTNNGTINAKLGKVAMASGERVTLDLYGDNLVEIAVNDQISDALIDNSGTINAEGGTVVLQASAAKNIVDNTINMSGYINASSATVQGGKIVLGAGNVKVAGKLDASGKTGGGDIDVTGKNIQVADTAVLQSDAYSLGDGGNVNVIAEDHTDFRGNIFARGGANGGNGGNAEVSGYKVLGYQGYADLSAVDGVNGTLLLDPEFAVIHSGLLHDPLGLGVVVSAQALANSMRNSTVLLQADDFIDVGTKQGDYNISTGNAVLDFIVNTGLNALPDGDIDLSVYDIWNLEIVGYLFGFIPIFDLVNYTGTTDGGLNLQAGTVNFNRNLTMGNGNLGIDADIVNLDSRIFESNGTALLGDSRLSSNANTVNVLSDSASIQQGVYLANDAGGGTVNVGAGTYQEQLTINKNLALVGAGYNDTVLLSPTTLQQSYSLGGRSNYAIVHVHDAADVDISGFQIDGSTNTGNIYNDNNRFIGVAYHNAGGDFSNNWVHNITTIGNSSRSGFAFLGSANSTARLLNITNNLFEDFQKYGIALADSHLTASVSGNIIRGNKNTQVNEQTGLYVTSAANVSADNNTIRNTDYGVEVIGAANGSYDANILRNVHNGFKVLNSANTLLTNNDIRGNSITGISLVNSSGSSVSDGIIDSFTNGILVDNSDDVLIDAVTFKNIADTTIDISNSDNATIQKNKINGGINGVKLANVTNSVIGGPDASFGNNIRNTSGAGILLSEANNNISIANNVLAGSYHGVELADNGGVRNTLVTIADNVIRDTVNAGIKIFKAIDIAITGNILRDIGHQGIRAQYVTGFDIVNNDIRNLGLTGIFIEDANDLSILNNDIRNSTGGNGLQLVRIKNLEVHDNDIRNVFRDGMNINLTEGADIRRNTIIGAGLDGIYLRNVNDGAAVVNNVIRGTGNDGIELSKINSNVTLARNDISETGEAGIRATEGQNIIIRNNTLHDIGHQGIRGQYIDGLIIRNNDIRDLGLTGMFIEDADDLTIVNNTIRNSAWGNGLQLVRIDNLRVRDNLIRNVYLDGMNINLSDNVSILDNTVLDAGDDGIYLRHMDDGLVVRGNIVRRSGGDGLELSRVDGSTIEANRIVASALSGIMLSESTNLDLLDNIVRGNTKNGIYAQGGANGTVRLAGNRLVDNDVGARFESGLIDLTGDANIINGGRTGLLFDPASFSPLNLNLLTDTIGTTEFNGQSQYYVELINGALYEPGQPTVIDALSARFDGVSASDDPSFILSVPEYNAINDKLWHFPNDNGVGLILFGFLPPTALIDQEDLFSYFNLLNLQTANLNITINGLPLVPGAPAPQGGTQFAFLSPADLNDITPAAGDDESTPDQMNRIDPQAGTQEASCWGDAVNLAQSGLSVNVSYGTSPEDTLNGAASCGGSI